MLEVGRRTGYFDRQARAIFGNLAARRRRKRRQNAGPPPHPRKMKSTDCLGTCYGGFLRGL